MGRAPIIAGIVAGAVLGVGGVVAAEVATEKADAQGSFSVTPGQLRINQKISQAAVRRANRNRTDIGALQAAGTRGGGSAASVQQNPPGPPGAGNSEATDPVQVYTRRSRIQGLTGVPADTRVDLIEFEVPAGSYVATGSAPLLSGGNPPQATATRCVIYTGATFSLESAGPWGTAVAPESSAVLLSVATQYTFTVAAATSVKLACESNRGWTDYGGELTVTRVGTLTRIPAQG